MGGDTRTGITSEVAETLRRILLASGTLTHAFGQSLADPEFAGLSSNADIAVLTSLHLSGPQRPRDLIDGAGLTTGGLSNLFDRLEQQQLIVRTYGRTDGDRRSALISLTANGTDLVDAIADAIRDTLTEQSALLQHLRDLIDSISDPTAPSPAPEPAPRPLEPPALARKVIRPPSAPRRVRPPAMVPTQRFPRRSLSSDITRRSASA